MQRNIRKRKEKGQATMLVLVALGVFLLAGMGLTLDVAQLYSQRQMAQNAADAAALAAMMSIFNGTNTTQSNGNNNTFPYSSVGTNIAYSSTSGGQPVTLNCASSPNTTPCYYAQMNGFSAANGDTIFVDFWTDTGGSVGSNSAFTQEPGVSFSTNSRDTVPLLRVIVQRNVPATLMKMVGGGTQTIAAEAWAAITTSVSQIPIMVLHPFASGSFSMGGNSSITILGGPSKSIQVNSCAGTGGSVSGVNCDTSDAVSTGGSLTIDLSAAGPTQKGGVLGSKGTPTSSKPPKGLKCGTPANCYISPASVIADPLLNVLPPCLPGTTTNCTTITAGLTNQDKSACDSSKKTCLDEHGNAVTCPSTDLYGNTVSSCTVLLPGLYTDKGPLGSISGFTIFTPGVYYIQKGGFGFSSNSGAQTQTPPPTTPSSYPTCTNGDANTGCGILIFLAADSSNNFDVGKNAGKKYAIALLGSDPLLSFQKILLFVDHTAPALNLSFGGGGQMNLNGTIYATSTVATTLSTVSKTNPGGIFQSMSLTGNSGSGTITGEIIVDELGTIGGGSITMNLDPATNSIRQIALVR
jgi:Flp pilus assembly protein TadG